MFEAVTRGRPDAFPVERVALFRRGSLWFPRCHVLQSRLPRRHLHQTHPSTQLFTQKDETVVFIPKERLITLEMAKDDPICVELISKKVELISPKHTYLSIFLLQEFLKQKDSPWFLYLDILPKDHRSFPINYSNEELIELVGSPFLMQVHEKVYDLKRDYDATVANS